MTIRFTIIAFFFLPVLVTAQAFQIDKPALSIDSLKKVLPLLQGHARVDCLNELARSYNEEMQQHYSDSALVTVEKAYKEAAAINYIKGLGDACLQYALIYHWRSSVSGAGDIDYPRESEKYYRQAISWYKKIHDDNGLGFSYRGLGEFFHFTLSDPGVVHNAFELSMGHFRRAGNQVMVAELTDCIGEAYKIKGDDEKAFEYIKKGLELKKQLHDNRGMIFSYFRLGLIYQFVGDMETALDYYHKSVQLATDQSVKWNEIFMHIGSIFMWTNRLDSADYYFRKLLAITPNNPRLQAAFGQLCMYREEYTRAIKYLHPALAYFKETHDWQEPWASLDLAKCYAGLKQYVNAFRYGRECAARSYDPDVMVYVYKMYSGIYEELKQKDSANFYFRKYVTIRDSLKESLSQRQQRQRLAIFKITTREEQQQARINLLNKDNQIKQQQLQKEALYKKILIGSLAVFVLLSFVVLRNITLKRKNEKHQRELAENELEFQKLESQRTKAALQQQATELEMQALRAQMNPHFIFNSLNSVNRFILQNNKAQASEYLTKFSRLVRLILQNSQAALIPLESELESLQLYLELEAVRFDYHFEFKISIEDNLDVSALKVPPLIIQPYAENAIWHGLMHKEEKGHLEIELFRQEYLLCCRIVDDGIGRKTAAELKSKSASAHKSMGMRITADRIAILQQEKQLNANIRITDLVLPDGSAGGTEVLLKIPVLYD